MNDYTLPEGCALILRTCNADMTSYGGFQWPESGIVECPDWDPESKCGNGLHGLLWGAGFGQYLDWDSDTKWVVAEVELCQIVNLNGKVKFRAANVIYVGDKVTATSLIARHAPIGTAIIGHTMTVGNHGIATVGAYGIASAGDYGTAVAGYRGTATAGDSGTATAGYYGTASAGDYGTATTGECGKASAGYRGIATARSYGTVTVGNYGTASVGRGGIASAGHDGTILIQYSNTRSRLRVGYIGEDGLLPNVKYRLDANANFVPAESTQG